MKEICPIVSAELKRLIGERVQISVVGMNFNPTGILKSYDSESGKVLLQTPAGHTAVCKTICFHAANAIAVGEAVTH